MVIYNVNANGKEKVVGCIDLLEHSPQLIITFQCQRTKAISIRISPALTSKTVLLTNNVVRRNDVGRKKAYLERGLLQIFLLLAQQKCQQ